MPKYTDVKILNYLEKPNFKDQSITDYLESVYDHEASTDPREYALERAFFAKKRSEEPLAPGLERVVKMEHKLLEVLMKMELRGVYVDAAELLEIGEELKEKSKLLLAEMHELVGEPFNPLSAKQVQYILFTKLNIPTGKKIKTGFSVDSETLEEISKTSAIAGLILEYRGYEKLRSTYCDGLIDHISDDDHRIHTTYKQTFTSTGRLSSESPNLQNIPTGGGYSGRIKSAFKPQEQNFQYVVADYSQVELRVLAMLSGDSGLIDAFKQGEDIHARTARFLFPSSEKISSEERRIAKSVNFGVIYGITGFGLSKMLKNTPKESTLYIDTFFAKYPGVRAYYDNLLAKARETGYVETYYGRRRFIKGLKDANSMMRAAAEREAMNMPVQGTAADIIKLAMIEIDEKITAGEFPGQLIMQVHDELVLEVPELQVDTSIEMLRKIMEGVLSLGDIHLKVDIHSGPNWSAAKG